MYQAYGLLKPDADFTLAAAAKKLTAKMPGFKVEQGLGAITVTSDDWEIHLALVAGPQVQAESKEIAHHISGDVDEIGIGACERRVEVSSDIPDPEMDHFDDFLSVIEVLRSFKGLIAIDPQEPSLL